MTNQQVKYHISDSGEVVECHAYLQGCPKQNFDTEQEAYEHLAATLSPLSAIKSSPSSLKKAQAKYGPFVTPYRMEVHPIATKVINSLSELGTPLIVGGSVRDSFSKNAIKDVDVELHDTTMNMTQIADILKKKGFTVDDVGKQFGVLKVNIKGGGEENTVDVSIPRKENKTGVGHREFAVEVDPDLTVEEAALRRDFTFNAIMYDPKLRVLIDPYSGKKDYDDEFIRHVSEKFSEDPLRVLRGFQFAGRFNMSYAPETAELCASIRREYETLSEERVREEWGKFFTKSTVPSAGVKALQESKWDDISPGLREALNTPEVVKSMDRINSSTTVPQERRLYNAATIMAPMGSRERKEFAAFGCANETDRKKVEGLLIFSDKEMEESTYNRKQAAVRLKKKGVSLKDVARFQELSTGHKPSWIEDAQREGIAEHPEELLLSGNDLLTMFPGARPGPWVGESLRALQEEQYQGRVTTKKEATIFLREANSKR